MGIANPYVVVIATTHPRSGEVTQHRMALEAYTVQDAVYQAMLELDAKHAVLEQQYKIKVLSVGPDTKQAHDRLASLLDEIGLLRMPTPKRTA